MRHWHRVARNLRCLIAVLDVRDMAIERRKLKVMVEKVYGKSFPKRKTLSSCCATFRIKGAKSEMRFHLFSKRHLVDQETEDFVDVLSKIALLFF